MKPSKHLKPGMTLIEVMIALALFAIFGSSLFMMQQYIFDRLIISQTRLIASLRMQEELAAYQLAILKEFFAYEDGSIKKSLAEKSREFSAPAMQVTITTKSDFATDPELKDSPFKYLKNLHVISAQAHNQDIKDQEKLYGSSYVFAYIPEIENSKE
ncbi:prepilin-type N-terminal cleavage/methylation domain-containing protein [Candidatus Babeliales bacterium]|nr:prepilin-type N-terminal cleavage/methylation domain-containing protein [Candidatus Babeliales bacterium]MBP9844164.1 prepilin-type N-terminal cleavage/methylation domain-containing protein [Candidatus Babeliales bacterium]